MDGLPIFGCVVAEPAKNKGQFGIFKVESDEVLGLEGNQDEGDEGWNAIHAISLKQN
jgi:hypothetical protein